MHGAVDKGFNLGRAQRLPIAFLADDIDSPQH
jgi:hypothetical protein